MLQMDVADGAVNLRGEKGQTEALNAEKATLE